MRIVNISTPTHGRVLIEDAAVSVPAGVVVGFHGYGQHAQAMLDELTRIPGSDTWTRISVQALHRFYTRNDQSVVASWMTREDRELAIADNIEYINNALDAALGGRGDGGRVLRPGSPKLFYVGFSQGASMAARAAVRGAHRAAGLILLAGDIPTDVRDDRSLEWPHVLLGIGSNDKWYGERIDSDVRFLESRGIPHEVVRFAGGHEFTDEFRDAAGRWLVGVQSARPAHPRSPDQS